MRFWDLSDPEIVAADALPWDMPFASALRPLTMRTITQVTLAGALLYAMAGGVGLGIIVTTDDLDVTVAHPTPLKAVCGITVGIGFLLFAGAALLSASTLRRLFPVGALLGVLLPPLIVGLAVYGVGPGFGDYNTVLFLEAPLFAFYICRLRWALLSVVLVLVSYGVVLVAQDGWRYPAGRWVVIASTVGVTAFIVGRMTQRAEELASAEHQARVELAEVNAELEDVNQTLEERVETQVAEIERLGELRRFLSPQVADALLSEHQDAVRRPHRARIAVFFCDLRGFTAFTNRAEPEEVVAALDEYYAVVGGLLQKHGATIGDYAGDGVMAYFGDPVPHPDPAGAALSMAHGLREPMARLVAEWRRLGYDLGYGVGVAYGYATLGVIGFDGRYDYTPIGGVVNLAARLCARAGDGEVLLDHAALAAADGRVQCEQVTDLDLKGYAADTRAYRLLGA